MSDPTPATGYQAGAFPGIPGTHAPGDYLLDPDARTATLIVDANSQVASPDPVSVPTPAPTPTDTPPSA
jgi:hypothetical protein